MTVLRKASDYKVPTVVILGDFTTPIGDASWRKEERKILDQDVRDYNLKRIRAQMEKLVPDSKIVLNSSFYSDFSISFLSEVLPLFNLGHLMSKDFLKCRLEQDTLTLRDVFYPVLQSYDFYRLVEEHGVGIQLGGQDQWGNITTGIEFIRKKNTQMRAGGLTIPLLTDSKGLKFGKSGKNTLFLDESLTKPYKVHQYFWNLSDDKIKELLGFVFSIEIGKSFKDPLEMKEAVIKALFDDVYGLNRYEQVKEIASLLFSSKLGSLMREQLEKISREIPFVTKKKSETLSSALVELGLSSSGSDSKRLVEEEKCIYLFNSQCSKHKERLGALPSISSYLLFRRGEKEFGLIYLED
ncbi:tyrosyl-tRNA synthetase [Candidatus Mycoplasma haematolamae str. Purdue]|uniref:Tyrosine--tRNA ligase n=1 Tax=Mycoplasma haematolamae (strain Purdue) TaxID=1212765 RepID=I7B8P4_MYCHA|nr:tyrosyl-tRNA synthetase [Candidatus Mycoplasma haematolamae str. Purdue]